MKNTVYIWLIVTTFILIIVTIMGSLNVAFHWVYFITLIGQVFLIVTVFKILFDDYKTDKTFEDWYEDCPRKNKKFDRDSA